ncbi:MAG: DUF4177 domain-containing protein [Acidobacteriota bacterium]|nr:DUF4177 domain-containing protein [Acidobacteriota bacterium]
MFTKILSSTLVLVFGCGLLFAQTAKKSDSDETWEYLIVSVVYSNDKENLNVADKWIRRRQGNVGFSQDNLTQNEFDRLGKLGWELIGIVPGGAGESQASIDNSKFIFKRRFDAARSAREVEESKQLAKDAKNNLPNKVNTEDLVELEQAEYKNKQNEAADKAKAHLEQIINDPNIISIKNVQTQYPKNNKLTSATIEVDGSSALLRDGNKYRQTEAKQYARQIAAEIFNKLGLKQGSPDEDFFYENGISVRREVYINLSIVIDHNGAKRVVARGDISGNWAETIK